MEIPIWLVKTLAWVTITAVAFGWMTALLIGVAWVQVRFFKAFRLVLEFWGSWAAYINFNRVQIAAAEGGQEYFARLIVPQEGEESHSPIPYFTVRPRPDLWRWWMRLLGAKKPK